MTKRISVVEQNGEIQARGFAATTEVKGRSISKLAKKNIPRSSTQFELVSDFPKFGTIPDNQRDFHYSVGFLWVISTATFTEAATIAALINWCMKTFIINLLKLPRGNTSENTQRKRVSKKNISVYKMQVFRHLTELYWLQSNVVRKCTKIQTDLAYRS